jgi:hypothetical protein
MALSPCQPATSATNVALREDCLCAFEQAAAAFHF